MLECAIWPAAPRAGRRAAALGANELPVTPAQRRHVLGLALPVATAVQPARFVAALRHLLPASEGASGMTLLVGSSSSALGAISLLLLHAGVAAAAKMNVLHMVAVRTDTD